VRNSTLYKIAGTSTFRLSSTKILKTHGSNLQNIEKELRSIYIPDGYRDELVEKCLYYQQTKDWKVFTEEELETLRIFVQVDQSGAEALIVAYLCESGNYRQLFINGIKPHSFLGMHLFKDVWTKKMIESRIITAESGFDIEELVNCPIPQLKQHRFWKDLDGTIKDSDNWNINERYYYLAKQTEHSSNYDIKGPTFQMNVLEKSGGKVVIDRKRAEHFLLVKHSLFPEIKQTFHRNVREEIERDGVLYNMHGMPYTITDYDIQESDWKEYYAWKPQSSVGMITNIAYARLQSYIEIEHKSWDILANTHDSYLCQCPLYDEQDCAKKMTEFMEQEMTSPVDGVKFRMKSEAQSGFNWSPAKLKQNKNLLGLRELKLL